MLRGENSNLAQQLTNKNLDLKKIMQQNDNLNDELDKINEEFNRVNHNLEQAENNYRQIHNKLNDKIQDVILIENFSLLKRNF
jgi:flagellar biosynthesis chaperone FliJ